MHRLVVEFNLKSDSGAEVNPDQILEDIKDLLTNSDAEEVGVIDVSVRLLSPNEVISVPATLETTNDAPKNVASEGFVHTHNKPNQKK